MKRWRKRRGGALVIALLTLLVVMLMSASVLRSILAVRRQAARTAAALQAAWLAESALDRAVVRMASEADYSGELWKVEIADASGQPIAAVAQIDVKTNDDGRRRIQARVEMAGVAIEKTMDVSEERGARGKKQLLSSKY